MNDKLRAAWKQADETGEPIDIGDIVVCDFCNEDYTERDDPGGLLFESKAVCPKCAPRLEADAVHFGETHFLKARAKPGQSFRAFCLELRGGNNTIHVRPLA